MQFAATDSKRASPSPSSALADTETYYAVDRLRRQYESYLTSKQMEIEEQKIARRYYHGAQWTEDQVRILRSRRQPMVTYNRVGRKINGIVGIAEKQRQDPKAYPRTEKGQGGADVATAAIRYIMDASSWQTFVKPECLRHSGIDGLSGVEMRLVDGDHGDPDIQFAQVFGDDYFYDPRSYKMDFSDKRFDGIAKWLDIEAAIELFPDKEEELEGLIDTGTALTTYADREFKWILMTERRVRLCEHWYRRRNQWFWAFYIGAQLLDEGISPFSDEKGQSMSRFIMFSAAVDQDGDRYGFVRTLQGPQDEINQRRSRALHISSSRRLIMTKGAVDDVETARVQWARPDGIVEVNPGDQFTVKPDDTSADLAAQFQFLEEAKNEMEGFANINPAALAGPGVKNLSGRAVNMLQAPGIAELGPFLIAYRDWCLRVYRASWCAAQRFWTSERWIRVTDDDKVAQFLQINGLGMDQNGQPVLVNALGNLDVDIIVDEGPDVVNSMADSFDVLSQMPPGSVPPAVLIELMPIAGSVKEKLIEGMQPKPDPVKVAAQQAELDNKKADTESLQAGAVQKRAAAMSDLASAAHKTHEAGLNGAGMLRTGLQTADPGPGAPGDAPLTPGQPMTPVAVPGAPPLPAGAPLASALMQRVPGPAPVPGPPSPRPLGQTAPGPAVGQPQGLPPMQGAMQAPDGNWYIHHPHSRGKFARVDQGKADRGSVA